MATQIIEPGAALDLGQLPRGIFERASVEYFQAHQLLPLAWDDEHLLVGAADVLNYTPADNLSQLLKIPVEMVFMDERAVEKTLRKLMESNAEDPRRVLSGVDGSQEKESGALVTEDLLQISDAPAVKIVNSILLEAVREKVTDVHFHPSGKEWLVMYRRDGMLQTVHRLAESLSAGVVARLKVMAKLDVTQHRSAQDGRISLKSAEKEIDVRVSTVPALQGERIVLRLLDCDNLLIRADELGMSGAQYRMLRPLMDRPDGMILVTGPTGSGKTTTLYSFISDLNTSQRNVMTIEDPVEYKIAGISQMAVSANAGLTFAQGLRAILRQDPDVILVGEIRDEETAQIAVRASLTGHLVVSTLHTRDAAGAMARLTDIGVEPYLVSSALQAIVSQRLVRKRCENCGVHGCGVCFQTGYRGRTGIFELLIVDDDFRQLMNERSDERALRRLMREKGIAPLEAAGADKVARGITTREEVLRVTGADIGDLKEREAGSAQ